MIEPLLTPNIMTLNFLVSLSGCVPKMMINDRQKGQEVSSKCSIQWPKNMSVPCLEIHLKMQKN